MLYNSVMSRSSAFSGMNLGRDEARYWHKRIYSGMVRNDSRFPRTSKTWLTHVGLYLGPAHPGPPRRSRRRSRIRGIPHVEAQLVPLRATQRGSRAATRGPHRYGHRRRCVFFLSIQTYRGHLSHSLQQHASGNTAAVRPTHTASAAPAKPQRRLRPHSQNGYVRLFLPSFSTLTPPQWLGYSYGPTAAGYASSSGSGYGYGGFRGRRSSFGAAGSPYMGAAGMGGVSAPGGSPFMGGGSPYMGAAGVPPRAVSPLPGAMGAGMGMGAGAGMGRLDVSNDDESRLTSGRACR